ncbi:LysR family transcriptional regulator [Actinobacteria bacterium YIM 96077]|uniref:LysR family transcriptional regulator n=1 Tax=Phytoactinopolyspora halophila TaxID=1981511 RepID=A0A329QFU6_9ACTN|nr:LysR family transcriptional regulator [Phytoactinopolyspora halophila]AYY13650.1 LysR family transcriptional regulator [Actinobacteria bacterium YIM 96077]RAW11214.1 LysR family transcriptional regulator [Phytoactinopolyspora halophila]
MDLVRHLEYFIAIAHERHFGLAAQRLGIRQPPLSQGLRRLESELGVRLFERDSQSVTVTDAGQALLPAAHRVLDEVEQLRLLARRQDTSVRTRVVIRVTPGMGAGHYAALVAACHRAAPEADVDVTEQASPVQVAELADGTADLGLLREPVVARTLHFGARIDLPLNAVVPGDHPVAGSVPVRLRDLGGSGLLAPPREHAPAAHDDLVATCERHGFLPENVREVTDERAAWGLVASGGYVGLTTEQPGRYGGVDVVPIEGDVLAMAVRLAWLDALSPPAEALPAAIAAALTSHNGHVRSADIHQPRAASELPAHRDAQHVVDGRKPR